MLAGPVLAALAYAFGVLFAMGWIVGESVPRAVACIAAGLFLSAVVAPALAAARAAQGPP
jgi:hypothetical protein